MRQSVRSEPGLTYVTFDHEWEGRARCFIDPAAKGIT